MIKRCQHCQTWNHDQRVECQDKRRKLHYASRGKLIGGGHPWKIANQIFFSKIA